MLFTYLRESGRTTADLMRVKSDCGESPGDRDEPGDLSEEGESAAPVVAEEPGGF